MDDEAKARWEGLGSDIKFEPRDFEVLDLALSLMPELRLCALAVKNGRGSKVKFPIENVEPIVKLVGDGYTGGGHKIGAKEIRRYMPKEFFPIQDEGELVSRVFAGLMRCNADATLAAHFGQETGESLDELLRGNPGESS